MSKQPIVRRALPRKDTQEMATLIGIDLTVDTQSVIDIRISEVESELDAALALNKTEATKLDTEIKEMVKDRTRHRRCQTGRRAAAGDQSVLRGTHEGQRRAAPHGLQR